MLDWSRPDPPEVGFLFLVRNARKKFRSEQPPKSAPPKNGPKSVPKKMVGGWVGAVSTAPLMGRKFSF